MKIARREPALVKDQPLRYPRNNLVCNIVLTSPILVARKVQAEGILFRRTRQAAVGMREANVALAQGQGRINDPNFRVDPRGPYQKIPIVVEPRSDELDLDLVGAQRSPYRSLPNSEPET